MAALAKTLAAGYVRNGDARPGVLPVLPTGLSPVGQFPRASRVLSLDTQVINQI
jgi:hypothetical protein